MMAVHLFASRKTPFLGFNNSELRKMPSASWTAEWVLDTPSARCDDAAGLAGPKLDLLSCWPCELLQGHQASKSSGFDIIHEKVFCRHLIQGLFSEKTTREAPCQTSVLTFVPSAQYMPTLTDDARAVQVEAMSCQTLRLNPMNCPVYVSWFEQLQFYECSHRPGMVATAFLMKVRPRLQRLGAQYVYVVSCHVISRTLPLTVASGKIIKYLTLLQIKTHITVTRPQKTSWQLHLRFGIAFAWMCSLLCGLIWGAVRHLGAFLPLALT